MLKHWAFAWQGNDSELHSSISVRRTKFALIGFLIARDLDTNTVRALKMSTNKKMIAPGHHQTIISGKGVLNQPKIGQFFNNSDLGVSSSYIHSERLRKGDRFESLRLLR